ncbi:DNA internalization-related competence protein ComEC/Rec2 [Massilia sp. TS11]|uniref:DNA internalization-related competence protein ComEC/Rec2 n=1 Tax=Massilia sp. TS11 TaxID=2908003 RepID=UPI001EDBB83A|nr:DNA internalization-related competence protein ComEC/Rec2 [Massilia sp. TS11]MCG2584600.1 DNA internalization-related competence protein ComEC/Rec2 [Massilia sp. TS11]
MRSLIIGMLGGVLALQTLPALPDPPFWLGLFAAAALSLVLARGRRAGWLLLAGVLAGFAWAGQLASNALAEQLPPALEGRDLSLAGVVCSLPFRAPDGVRFEVCVESGEGVPQRIVLGWYARGTALPPVAPGQRWLWRARLQRPHGAANPYGFDIEAWWLEQGIRATGYVRSGRLLADFVATPRTLIERARAALRARIEQALAGAPYSGVIVALVIGDQRGIGQDDWAVFNRTGIGHLISISGLHITMLAALAALVADALWRRSARLPLVLPAQKFASIVGLTAAGLYVLLAGAGVPAQRTFCMLAVVVLALWLGRVVRVSHILCLALGVVLLLDPWCVLWPGFWLSFGAVGVILYAHAGRVHRLHGWREALRTQYAVTLGLVPLSLLLFAQVSLVSPLANAVAIPLVSVVVAPLSLLGAVAPAPLGGWLLQLAHALIALLARLLYWLSGVDWAVWSAPAPSLPVFVLAMIGTLWLLAPRGWPVRWAGIAAWLPLLLARPQAPPPGQAWVTAFDVGQGMALLIETAQHRLMYDAGPAYTPENNGANRVLLPYLQGRGIGRLDGFILSHRDMDHAGGANTLLASVRTDWVLSSAMGSPCVDGQQWEWDGVRFRILHPLAASYANPGLNSNARSCTLLMEAAGQRMLLAGDIEAAQEAELVARAGTGLRSAVLLAPHHGSGTSSTPMLLDAVAPGHALFQVGYRNRYHHPKAAVEARYRQRGIQIWRSDRDGAVRVELGPQVRVSAYRATQLRYWFSAAGPAGE